MIKIIRVRAFVNKRISIRTGSLKEFRTGIRMIRAGQDRTVIKMKRVRTEKERCWRPRPQPTYSEIEGRAKTGILLSRHFLTTLNSLSLTSLRSKRGPGYNR